MLKLGFHKVVLICIAISLHYNTNAQINCTEQLRQAERRFDEGLLDEIPMMVKPCMASGFTKEEKVNAYKLLIQTYLYNDNKHLADEEMHRFLKDFPDYKILQTDSKEFVNLYKTYRTEPIMRIEPYLGGNYSMPYLYEYYGVGDLNKNVPEYTSNFGVTAGVNYTNKLTKDMDWSVGLSMHYTRVGYFYQVFDHTYLDGTYTQMHAAMPVSTRYYFSLNSVKLFAKVGFEAAYLIQSKNNLVRGFNAGGDNIVGDINLTNYHKRIDLRPHFGVGFSPRFGNVNLIVDGGFKMGTIIPVDPTLRYSNNELFEKFYFIEDKWIFNHLFINVAYVFSVYKPVKIQQ
jgi:hypothetical protein